jgi:3D (Asp-Asp-Asp) domain-containing protein
MLKIFKKTIRKIAKVLKEIHYKFNVLLLVFVFSCSLVFPQHTFAQETIGSDSNVKLQGIIVRDALLPVLNSNINRLSLKQVRLPEIKDRELVVFNYRYVTAYNVGVVAQTDNTPCIGASGDDLCELFEQGVNICAANFVRLGTNLEIEGFGTCVVLDRMNKRYTSRVDILMGPNEIAKARQFGLQYREVGIY